MASDNACHHVASERSVIDDDYLEILRHRLIRKCREASGERRNAIARGDDNGCSHLARLD
jgi:hypothetical protein